MSKILFFATYYHPYLSGITTYPDKILTKLANQHQIKVLTFRHDSKLPLSETYHDYQIKRLKYWLRLSKGFISPSSLLKFYHEMRRHEILVLNIPNAEGLPLALMAKLMRKKVIAIFHCQVSYDRGLFNNFLVGLLRFSIYCQLALADSIVGYTRDYVRSQSVGRKFKNKFEYALPPVDAVAASDQFRKQLLAEKEGEKWIGFAGRISGEKGLVYLVKALALLKDKHQFKLVLVGPYGSDVVGEEDYYHQVKELLNEFGLKHQFLGKVSRLKLGSFYQAIDVLVLPSTSQTEAFGLVQAEAMLVGKPVVVSDLPGVRQLVQMTGMGRVVVPKNSQALAGALKQVLDQPQQYANSDSQQKVKAMFAQNQALSLIKKLIN